MRSYETFERWLCQLTWRPRARPSGRRPCYTRVLRAARSAAAGSESVNEAIGKLRLLELEPLKLAIMDALQRAWSFMPPLHVQSKEGPTPLPLEHGFERKVELQRAIDCLAIDDTQLRQLCNEFRNACDDAGRRWFEARRHAEAHQLDVTTPGIRAVYQQHPYDGEKAVAQVRDLYIKLSQHIEKLLR